MESKHPAAKYAVWIGNFLKLQAPAYVLTDAATHAGALAGLIGSSGKRNVHVHLREMKDFHCNTLGIDWSQQHSLDPEGRKHTPELYQVWAEKVHFVRTAIEANVFQTGWFAWADIGSFRAWYDLPVVYESFPLSSRMRHGRIQFGQIAEPNEAEQKLEPDGLPKLLSRDIINGAFMFGDPPTFLQLHQLYYSSLLQYYRRGDFVGKDQQIFTACCILQPDLFELILPPPKYSYRGAPWFYPQLHFSRGAPE